MRLIKSSGVLGVLFWVLFSFLFRFCLLNIQQKVDSKFAGKQTCWESNVFNVEEVNLTLSEFSLIKHELLQSFSQTVQHQRSDGVTAEIHYINSMELGVKGAMKVL